MTEESKNTSSRETHAGTDLPAVMMAVVTGQKSFCDEEYLKVKTESPVATYDTLNAAGIINKDDFSGVSIDKTQKYKKERQWVETRAGHTESAGRGICDDWEPEHWVDATGYYHDVELPDGLTKTTCITSSKRADIRQEPDVLFLAHETINQEALQKSYKAALSNKPVKDVLHVVLGAEKTKSLTDAFNAVRALKPLSIEDTLDNGKITPKLWLA
jgi:hypothetical protein